MTELGANYGYAKSKEGEQYQLYKRYNPIYNQAIWSLAKPYNGRIFETGTHSWLRSPYCESDSGNWCVLSAWAFCKSVKCNEPTHDNHKQKN